MQRSIRAKLIEQFPPCEVGDGTGIYLPLLLPRQTFPSRGFIYLPLTHGMSALAMAVRGVPILCGAVGMLNRAFRIAKIQNLRTDISRCILILKFFLAMSICLFLLFSVGLQENTAGSKWKETFRFSSCVFLQSEIHYFEGSHSAARFVHRQAGRATLAVRGHGFPHQKGDLLPRWTRSSDSPFPSLTTPSTGRSIFYSGVPGGYLAKKRKRNSG